jgi:hypothetical protein
MRLWLSLAALLLASVVAGFLVRVPVYASGSAVVTDPSDGKWGEEAMVVIFTPPEYLTELRPGRQVVFRADTPGELSTTSIVAVLPHIMTPKAARERFALDRTVDAAVDQPSAVALASPNFTRDAGKELEGRSYQVNVEVGARPALTLLPLIGQLFGGR